MEAIFSGMPAFCALKQCAIDLPRNNADEKVLLSRCRVGELAAFDVLLEHHRERVLNLAFQLLGERNAAEDVAQEVFVNAFANIAQFRGDAAFFTWLYRLTLNACHASLRRRKDWISWDEKKHAATNNSSPEKDAIAHLSVQRTLSELTPTLRSVLVLRELHELSYEEIAQVMHLPVGTVRSRLHEGRRRFREIWEAL
jgi:RNA polymerase sigma-70 factor (ECF subfamily)